MKTAIMIGLCVFILGGLIFLQIKKRKRNNK
jgi:LPXTG-motif cell wall-anchored protein